MDAAFLETQMRDVEELRVMYMRLAAMLEPSPLQENPESAARAYMGALRGAERCIDHKTRLMRDAARLPRTNPAPAMGTVDLSRLSDDALREVEQALVPLSTPRNEEPEPEPDRPEQSCQPKEKTTIRPCRPAPDVRAGTAADPKPSRMGASPLPVPAAEPETPPPKLLTGRNSPNPPESPKSPKPGKPPNAPKGPKARSSG